MRSLFTLKIKPVGNNFFYLSLLTMFLIFIGNLFKNQTLNVYVGSCFSAQDMLICDVLVLNFFKSIGEEVSLLQMPHENSWKASINPSQEIGSLDHHPQLRIICFYQCPEAGTAGSPTLMYPR